MPAVHVLLTECARIFGERSAGHYPVFSLWMTYAHNQGIDKPALKAFLGHRYNILFELAAEVFRLRGHFLDFIERNNLKNYNQPLKVVENLLNDELVLTHLQILAFIGFTVTFNILNLATRSDHLLQTCDAIEFLMNWIQDCIDSPEKALSGNIPMIIENAEMPDPLLFENLITYNLESPALLSGLHICFQTALSYLEQNFAPFIGDGYFSTNRDRLWEELKSCGNSNIVPESVFVLNYSNVHCISIV